MTRLSKLFAVASLALPAVGCASDGPREHVRYYQEEPVYEREVAAPPPRAVYRDYRDDDRAPAPAYRDERVTEVDAPPVEVVAGPVVEVTEFHERLSPYGRWVREDTYGDCWIPAGVAEGWRPYTVGRWVETDYGWTFVSEEPFGDATYHYGRWTLTRRYGWVWVPGRQWGPAWVAWRSGGGYCGWAPLPPETVDRVVITDYEVRRIPEDSYVFCDERYIAAPRIEDRCLPRERNVTIINRTTNITNITVVNNRVINRGVPVAEVERYGGTRVVHADVRRANSFEEVHRFHEAEVQRVQRATYDHEAAHDQHVAQHDALHDQHAAEQQALHDQHVVEQRNEHDQHVASHDAAHDARVTDEQRRIAAEQAARDQRIGAHDAAHDQRVTAERDRLAHDQQVDDRQAQEHAAAHDARVAAERDRAAQEQQARDREAQEHAAAHDARVAAERDRAAQEQQARDRQAQDHAAAHDARVAAERDRAAQEQQARDRQAQDHAAAHDQHVAEERQRAADQKQRQADQKQHQGDPQPAPPQH